VADQQYPVATQMRRVVEAAGIPEADGRMELRVHEHALGLTEREHELAIDRDLDAARGGHPLGTRVQRLHVEQESRAIRRPADWLFGESALERLRADEDAADQVIVRHRRPRRAQRAQQGHAGQDQDQRGPRKPPARERGDRQDDGRGREQVRRGKDDPRGRADARGEGRGGRKERRGLEPPLNHSR